MCKKLTYEEKKARVAEFRPIDDVFFELLASNPEVCEEILRTILEDSNITVEDVIVQSSERNIYGRSVRLDALCTLGNGSKCNIEVQRADNDDHKKRVRFNAASITAKESDPGEKFENVPNVCVVYISEKDFFRKGKTIYHIDKVIRETGDSFEDGQTEIFVNTAVDDGTDIAELMSCFVKEKVNNPKFPKFSEEVRKLKETEGGLDSMCTLMEKYNQEAVNEEIRDRIIVMLNKNYSVDQIADIYAEIPFSEIERIRDSLCL